MSSKSEASSSKSGVSPTTTAKISLAMVGLLVGAGFASGKEVIQYFVSFGIPGLWGTVLAGLLITASGAVVIQFGSYFLAEEHQMVFRDVAHPLVSRFLDIAVSFTLFAIGFVMLAGAGSTLEQQYGVPTWIGAGAMTLLVMATGMLDVDKVSNVISAVTPLVMIAVVFAFGYTMMHLPGDLSGLESIAQATTTPPVSPWWLSALNYTGLSLLLAVSMVLVIGGSHPNPKEAAYGGLAGGALYTVLLLMNGTVLFITAAQVGKADIPMLSLFETIHPILAHVMVGVVLAMIFNTAIGMFYALGQRLTAKHRNRYRAIYLGMCLLGYGVSFVGFTTLMTYVYPALGYIGMFLAIVLGAAWWRYRARIQKETGRRVQIRDLLTARDDPRQEFGADEEAELQQHASDSNIDDAAIVDAVEDDMDDDSDDGSDDDRGDTDGSGGSKDAPRDGDVTSTRG